MRYLVITIFLLIPFLSWSQGKKVVLDSGSYLWLNNLRTNFYVEPIYELATVKNDLLTYMGLSAGALVNDRFTLGAFFGRLIDDYFFVLIFPNEFRLNMVYGGFQAGYYLPVHNRISIGTQQRLGFGEMLANRRYGGEPISGGNFMLWHPSIGVDVHVVRYVKLHANIGYKWLDRVDIHNFTTNDFAGPVYQVSLKVGIFKRVRKIGSDEKG